MAQDHELDRALDVRIEPWHFKMPGCMGACQQGRLPCAHPEECLPDRPQLTRSGCLVMIAGVILTWVLIGAVAMGIGYLWGLR